MKIINKLLDFYIIKYNIDIDRDIDIDRSI